jgi:hypothetical protein
MMAEQENDGAEASAWAEVLGRWEDDAAHRAFLDRFRDLEGLARAGGLYRDVLAARPGDPVALRWRDEVLRRATAAGLASLPRATADVPHVPAWVRPVFLVFLGLVIAACSFLLFKTMTSWSRP